MGNVSKDITDKKLTFVYTSLSATGHTTQAAITETSVTVHYPKIKSTMTSSDGNISALLALCFGNPSVTGGFQKQRPVTRNFDVFFDLRLTKTVDINTGDLRRRRGDVIKCKHFPRYWPFVRGIHRWLLPVCAGNSPVIGEFPAQRPVTRSFDVFFDLRLNKRLSKQSRGW